MHTARWDKAVETAGRRVAVIGSAASAIQAIPELARTSARVTVFQRTPNYIAPRMDRAYTDKEKRRFAKWPLLARLHRYKIFMRMELLLFPVTKKDSKQGRIGARRIMEWMRSQVKDPELQEQLVPDYALGCKRILISDNFYRTLNRENVELVTEGIEKIVPQGVVTSDGKLHAADVIVYATGFDIEGHMFSIPVRGRSGIPLTDSWKHLPEAYQGACTSGFPNYFMITGPNTGVSTTSVVFMIEHLLHYILELIDLADDDKIIEVTREAEDAYNQKLHAALENTLWATGGCKSWYRREDGKITTLYPYDARTFKRQVSKVKPDHFTLLGVPSTASPGA
jgi:cation diffusion facilitator CzcD-associated flavoprotein CzcO